ncbi:MAG: hypothetical protein RIG62_26545 [Cyclobacteriaceae bacterium]
MKILILLLWLVKSHQWFNSYASSLAVILQSPALFTFVFSQVSFVFK